jgi:uncharacterized SAM-binding protein YcdF (DUF218 family)
MTLLPHHKKFLHGIMVLFTVAMLVDGMRFWMVYSYWSSRAELGLGQLASVAAPKEAIVVLTGDIRRIPKAIELLRKRDSEVLIISGTAKGVSLTEVVNRQGDASTHIHEVWDKIVLDAESTSTLENAEKSGALLQQRRLSHLVLVTSDYHMDRALAVFVRALPGRDILGFSVQSQGSSLKIFQEYWKNLLFRYFGYWAL